MTIQLNCLYGKWNYSKCITIILCSSKIKRLAFAYEMLMVMKYDDNITHIISMYFAKFIIISFVFIQFVSGILSAEILLQKMLDLAMFDLVI